MKWFQGRFWACAMMFAGCLMARTPDIANQKNEIRLLESRMDSLRIHRSVWENESKILTKEIEVASRTDDRSLGEHRELEKLMRQSQKLEKDIRMSEQAINQLSEAHQAAVQRLVNEMQNLMTALMDSAEQAQNNIQRDRLLRRLDWMIADKKQWESRMLHKSGSSITQYSVKINPWDNPEDIRMKRDVILDMEEAMRNEIKDVDRQIKSLRNEESMRKKMADLFSELSLFDETEETANRNIAYRGHFGNQQAGIDEGYQEYIETPTTRGDAGLTDNSKTFDGFYADEAFPPMNSEWETPAPGNRTPLSLANRIEIMTRYRAQLAIRADSLNLSARQFEQRASQMDH